MDKKKEEKETESTAESKLSDTVRELKPAEYIRSMNGYMLKGNHKSAYAVIQRAVVMCPDDPFVLSFYGCLQSMVDKKHRSGVDNCTKALAMVQKRVGTIGRALVLPVLYLNLGKAYVAAGKKKNAVTAFNQGLRYDPEHTGIRKEMQKMGARKKPLVSFLDRSNPVNKYLGRVLNSKKNKSNVKK